MLPIGKLAPGQSGCYLEQAPLPLTRAGGVSWGVSEWTGAGAALSNGNGNEANWLDASGPGPHDRLQTLVAALGHSTAPTLACEGAHR